MKNAFVRKRRNSWNKTITGFQEDKSNKLTLYNKALI